MSDSLRLFVWFGSLNEEQYALARLPARGADDPDAASGDFRDQYPKSPLTGAGFKITPIGRPLRGHAGSIHDLKNRMLFGDVVGYAIDFNPPACTVGHNRELVNGVPAAAKIGLALLKHWVVENGATELGLRILDSSRIVINSATPTFLFPFKSEAEARIFLAAFRSRSETILNKGKKGGEDGKLPAFSIASKSEMLEKKNIYTSYVKSREFQIDAYVKVPDAAGSYCKPVVGLDSSFEVMQRSMRTFRLGVKINGKWLRQNGLDTIDAWVTPDNTEGWDDPYEKVFSLVRSELRLDEKFRTKQLRINGIAGLNITESDKNLLMEHIKGRKVRESEFFQKMEKTKGNKAYSAARLRVYERTNIDFDFPYELQKKTLSPELSTILVYPGEYEPSESVGAHIFSRTTVPAALAQLQELTEAVLINRDC